MSLTNLNSSNSKSILINSGNFRSGVYITSPNQFLSYTDNNGMNAAYYYNGPLPYTTIANTPTSDSPLWKVLYIADKYSYLKSDIVPITSGGTGANNTSQARSNLGLGTTQTPLFSNLELSSNTPFIDFHFNNSSDDYTSRIIENSSGVLSLIGSLSITNDVSIQGTLTLTNSLSLSNGGTGANNAVSARTNLGLGTAAVQNIGTSGTTVPLLSTANIWSSSQTNNSEIISTSQNIVRGISGNYGFIMRNDGTSTYMLLTNSGDVNGQWNSLRPLTITNSNGLVAIGNGLTVSGNTTLNTPLAITSGGTGATTAAAAASALGLGTSNSPSFSNITVQYTKSTGTTTLSPSSQGAYVNWNQVSSTGTTDFLNHRGSGIGGFNFWNGTTSQTLILSITDTGNLRLNNNISLQSKNTSNTALDLIKIDSSNISQIGNTSIPTNINSSVNPTVKVGTNTYTLYSTGNKPTVSAFRASYLTTAGSDSKQTLTASNTPQTLLVNTVTAASSIITANTSTGTFLSNVTQGMMLCISAQIIREVTGGGDVYWMMFLETSPDGTTWTPVTGSNRIVTLSSSTTNEMKQVDFSVAIQSTAGTYLRIRHACTDSTKTVSVISKDSLFAGVPISSGLIVSFLTI